MRNRSQPDSALLLLKLVVDQLDSLHCNDSKSFYRTLLAQSQAYADKERYLLALKAATTVAAKSIEAQDWRTAAEAKLTLSRLQISLLDKSSSLEHLKLAEQLINQQQFNDLQPLNLLLKANWHLHFGFRDSVLSFLGQLLDSPQTSPMLEAEAYRIWANRAPSTYSFNKKEAYFRRALRIYQGLDNYKMLSKTSGELASLYLKIGYNPKALSTIDTTIRYCYEAINRNQDVAYTLALAYQFKGLYYRNMHQLDSAYAFGIKGMEQEMQYWQRSEMYKASEAAQIHRNNQRDQLLVIQERQLRIEHNRNLGLAGFSSLILFLSFGTIYLYSKLKESNQITKNQSKALEISNNNLEESLRLQVLLKAELQHRVKNNMQLILSIFNRGQKDINDPELKMIMNERKEQVQSIVLLHQKIDLESEDREVDPEEYLGELITNIEKSYSGVFPEVKLRVHLNVDLLHIDATIPLGLILNELVTNAYKYAFPKGEAGNIDVTFSKLPSHYYLRVADNGVGLPEDVNIRRHHSMGTRLVKGLTRQLEGSIIWIPTELGTVVQLTFPPLPQAMEV